MTTPIKKPVAMAVANGLDTSKQNFFRFNCNWSLPPLASVAQEIHWRQLTNSSPFEAVLQGYSAPIHFEPQQSAIDRMVIDLPEAFNPSIYSWPVFGLNVLLVETGCYERQLLELCQQYGANFVQLQSRDLEPGMVYPGNMLEVAA